MTTYTYRGVTIEKRIAWHNDETLGYKIFEVGPLMFRYFDTLCDAQAYIRSKNTIIYVGGE